MTGPKAETGEDAGKIEGVDSLGYPDGFDFTLIVQFFHLFPCPLDIIFKDPRAVNEVQVDVLRIEVLETLLTGLSSGFGTVTPFGGDPDFVS